MDAGVLFSSGYHDGQGSHGRFTGRIGIVDETRLHDDKHGEVYARVFQHPSLPRAGERVSSYS